MAKKSKKKKGTPKIKSNKHAYNGINFKSTLEKDAYLLFTQWGFKFEYEPTVFTMLGEIDLVKTNIIKFSKRKQTKKADIVKYGTHRIMPRKANNIKPMSYTPDFIIYNDDALFIVETKGWANDAYPLRKKVFFHYIESVTTRPVYFFELKNKVEIKECCKYIKNKIK